MPKCVEKEVGLSYLSNILSNFFPARKMFFSVRVCIFSSHVYVMIVIPNFFLLLHFLVLYSTGQISFLVTHLGGLS